MNIHSNISPTMSTYENDKDINSNRIGNGFSRILNLVNVRNNKRDKG